MDEKRKATNIESTKIIHLIPTIQKITKHRNSMKLVDACDFLDQNDEP